MELFITTIKELYLTFLSLKKFQIYLCENIRYYVYEIHKTLQLTMKLHINKD